MGRLLLIRRAGDFVCFLGNPREALMKSQERH